MIIKSLILKSLEWWLFLTLSYWCYLALFNRSNFLNPASSPANLTWHSFKRVKNLNFEEISDYPLAVIYNLQPESWCFFCNSLLLKIDLVDWFGIWVRNPSYFAGPLNSHALLIDQVNELFTLLIRHLHIVVFLCHPINLLYKEWSLLFKYLKFLLNSLNF